MKNLWNAPEIKEVYVGMEINCYVCAEVQVKMVDKTGFPEGEQKHRFDKQVGKFNRGQQLNKKTINRFITKSGGLLNIAKQTPSTWKVPAILAALGIGYIGSKIETWLDERTGKTGKIPEELGTPTPKDTGPKALRAKPDPVKRAADRTQDYQKKARGGPIKKYAKGGGVRKAARY